MLEYINNLQSFLLRPSFFFLCPYLQSVLLSMLMVIYTRMNIFYGYSFRVYIKFTLSDSLFFLLWLKAYFATLMAGVISRMKL